MYNLEINKVLKELNTKNTGLVGSEFNNRQSNNAFKRQDYCHENNGKSKTFIVSLFLNSILLFCCSLTSLILFLVDKKVYNFIITLIIFLVLITNFFVSYLLKKDIYQNFKKFKNNIKSKCRVLRDNKESIINSDELVVGDIVLLRAGDVIDADIRLLECENLVVDEKLITGEVCYIKKSADEIVKNNVPLNERLNIVYGGSYIIEGNGKGVVYALSINSEIHKVDTVLGCNKNIIKKNKIIKNLEIINVILPIVTICLVCLFGFIYFSNKNLFNFNNVILLNTLLVCLMPQYIFVCTCGVLNSVASKINKNFGVIKNFDALEKIRQTNTICISLSKDFENNNKNTDILAKQIEKCFRFNINCILITEHDKDISFDIAKSCQIASDLGQVLTGDEFEKLNLDEVNVAAKKYTVFSKLIKNDRAKLITALKQLGGFTTFVANSPEDLLGLNVADIKIAIESNNIQFVNNVADIIFKDNNNLNIISLIDLSKKLHKSLLKINILTCCFAVLKFIVFSILIINFNKSFIFMILLLTVYLISNFVLIIKLNKVNKKEIVN